MDASAVFILCILKFAGVNIYERYKLSKICGQLVSVMVDVGVFFFSLFCSELNEFYLLVYVLNL